MMKKNYSKMLAALLLAGMASCDPAYEYCIEAKNEDMLVEIHPSLESLFCPDLKDVCDFAASHRVGEEKDRAAYRSKKGDKFTIFGGIGTRASVDSFPFDFVKVIYRKDTLLLRGKEEILKKFVRNKNNMYYFTW